MSDAPPLRRPRAQQARQVADLLRHEILGERTRPTELRAEHDLLNDYGVSRNTIREALALLKDEGLIARAPRIGTHVTGVKYPHGLDRLAGLKESLSDWGEVRNEVRTAVSLPPPPAVARRLQVSPGDHVVYLERLRYVGELPVSLDLTYLVADIGAQILEHDLADQDIFPLIEAISGSPLGHADFSLEAVAADSHTAATLQIPAHSPLMLLERLTHLADGRPVDLEFVRFRADRITMRGSLFRTEHMLHTTGSKEAS